MFHGAFAMSGLRLLFGMGNEHGLHRGKKSKGKFAATFAFSLAGTCN
jgi:hypothetical protein